MLKGAVLVLATVTMLGSAGVSAQTIDLGGRGGPSIDLRNEGQRERDLRREERARDRAAERRARDRDGATGSVGRCRQVTVRERDDMGRTVTRRTEECR